jgi:hypothetical protein
MKNRYEDHIERVLDFHFCGAEGGWRPVEPRTSCAFQRLEIYAQLYFVRVERKREKIRRGPYVLLIDRLCVAD